VVEHEIWPLLSCLPYDAQRIVVQRVLVTSTELFDLLREKSRQEGRRDPQRGIEIAELALLSLDASAAALGERIHELRALGLAWVGNARRLALDFPGAEETFEKAMAELALVKDWKDSVVAGDVYALKGSLRTFQRRFEEALELLARSVTIFEKAGDSYRQTEELMTRAAAAYYAGWSGIAISDLTVALSLVKKLNAKDLSVMVAINLGNALVYSGQFEPALEVVKAVDKRFCLLVNPLWLQHVKWVEGAAEHGLGNHASAEEKYLAALAGFEDLGQPFYCAFVDLDLAILYAETSRPAAVVRTSAGCLRFFKALTLGRETMMSLRLLKDALERQAVTAAVLRDLRCSLLADPLAALSKKAEPGSERPGPITIVGL
ncbi:MAG: hypothetical protein GY835_16200, partial [bacterium]|nr:hypothetical protein [bacterium]